LRRVGPHLQRTYFAVKLITLWGNAALARYIPFDRAAGETEFLEKIYSSREEIEPLCDNTVAEQCYYVSSPLFIHSINSEADISIRRHGTTRGSNQVGKIMYDLRVSLCTYSSHLQAYSRRSVLDGVLNADLVDIPLYRFLDTPDFHLDFQNFCRCTISVSFLRRYEASSGVLHLQLDATVTPLRSVTPWQTDGF
jgi:hypothetical protein